MGSVVAEKEAFVAAGGFAQLSDGYAVGEDYDMWYKLALIPTLRMIVVCI